MSAFAILDVEIDDIAKYLEFMQAIRPVLEAAGGRYLARGGDFKVLEGDYQPRRLVLIEFPDMDALEAYYRSEEHLALKSQRDTCSSSRLVALEGLRALSD